MDDLAANIKQAIWDGIRFVQTILDIVKFRFHRTDKHLAVFFGDSRAKAWSVPQEVAGFKFVNRGIGLNTTGRVLARFNYHVKPLLPHLIIVQAGVNDFKSIALSPEQKESVIVRCQKNIEEIVQHALHTEAHVVLSTIFPIGKTIPSYIPGSFWIPDVVQAIVATNDYIRSLAGSNVTIFDAYTILVDEEGLLQGEYSRDFLHLNARGYYILNQELKRLIEREFTN